MTNENLLGGVAAAMIMLAAGGALAARMAAAPAPGFCKGTYEAAIAAGSVQAAQLAWVEKVAAKHGESWSHWSGAKDKFVTPLGGSQFQAAALPCLHHPVP